MTDGRACLLRGGPITYNVPRWTLEERMPPCGSKVSATRPIMVLIPCMCDISDSGQSKYSHAWYRLDPDKIEICEYDHAKISFYSL